MQKFTEPFVVNTIDGLKAPKSQSRDLLIDWIFEDEDLRRFLHQQGAECAWMLSDQNAFLQFLKVSLDRYFESGEATIAPDEQYARIGEYASEFNRISTRFAPSTKPNPEAVFWPDPTQGGAKLQDVLPVAVTHPFIDHGSRIGSAGSCFAIEIAQNLMSRGFNYICQETTYDAETETIVMGTSPEDPVVQYSCRWGILFNTPSFTQIVENAFGVRPLPPLLVRYELGNEIVYLDPYRENVMFKSPEAYMVEREKHAANTRAVFENADVFVMTLGLNEAWQYLPDGTYISRNPRNKNLNGLLTHRTLSVEENIDYLQRFVDVVRAHNPNIKLVVTVSPVPFLATGRADEYHVITANGHSKAVLRVAAQEIVERNENVFYFPSYEVVTVCSPEIWTEDQRHVHPDAIRRVMATFDEMFLTDEAKAKVQAASAAGEA